MSGIAGLFARSAALTAAAVLLGVTVNAVRADGIPVVAPRPYEIYVPCPETETEAETISAEDVAARADVLYLDARPSGEYGRAHIKGAESFPYPLLEDPPQSRVDALKNKGVPIVTYGDGGRGDLGEMLASLLTELGVPNVSHLEGGLPAWRARDGAVDGEPSEADSGPGEAEPGSGDAGAAGDGGRGE